MYIGKSNKEANWDKFQQHAFNHALMSFSKPFYFSFSIYNLFHVMNDMLALFYGYVYFIEDNERFKLGGEDLEKLKIFKISNLFQKF